MLFSIITITYNAEKYLAETLKSVCCQTCSDYEHIIWDGGSTDRTLEIARNFPHVQIFQGKDEGISDAMNKGANFAKGKYLLHLHADDLLADPKVLERVSVCLKQHPEIRWLYGRAHIIDEKGDVLRTTPMEPFQAKRLRKYNFITHPATFVEKDLFQKVGGFENRLRYTMDYDLWLRLSRFSNPFTFSSVLACFREHTLSLSTSEPFKVASEAYQVRNRYVENIFERYRSYRTWKRRIKKLQNSE